MIVPTERETAHQQLAIDLFRGEWSSRFPVDSGYQSGGSAFLFEDRRLRWFLSRTGSLARKRVLELGPLEGGHTYMIRKAGAASVLAIEANTRAYLKCLIAKELFAMSNVRFQLGDFNAYLESSEERFDIVLASGVLYHQRNPVELIEQLAGRCRDLYVWTHYHDEARAQVDPALASTLSPPVSAEHAGFRHELIRKSYGAALNWQGFCGGSADYACWMQRDQLLAAFTHFGFNVLGTAFERPDHPNGPALSLHARWAGP